MSVEGTAEKQITPIFKVLDKLDQSVAILDDVTARLRGHLTPVTSKADPVEKTPESLQETFGSSDVYNRISGLADALDGLIRVYREIIEGLEV